MENVLNAMRRENDARVASLPPGYRETAQRMGKRLEKSDLSPFAVEDIRREVVGMAIEAQGQGQTLEEFLGNDEEGFCADVIYNGKKRTLAERLAVSLPVVAWVAFVMLLLLLPTALQRGNVWFCMTDMVVMGWMAAWVLYFSTYPKKRLVTVLWWVVMAYWFLLGGYIFAYPIWVRVVLQVVLFAFAYWNRWRVYNARAAEYGWNAA